jgi:hypothetical protein
MHSIYSICNYVAGHERASTIVLQGVLSVMQFNILEWLCQVWLVLLRNMTVYEDLEGFSPFQNMHIGNILIDQLSKIVSKSLI